MGGHIGFDMTPSQTKFGRFIRARRLEFNISQVELAKSTNITQQRISKLETGLARYPKKEEVEQLAKALKCNKKGLCKLALVKPGAQPKTKLGRLVRSRRQELGFSLLDFAKKLNMDIGQVRWLELKQNPTIHYDLVKLLAKALDVDISVLTRFIIKDRKQTKSELGQLICRRRKELLMSLDTVAKK